MLTSSATFAFFMSSQSSCPASYVPDYCTDGNATTVGSVIRTDGLTMREWAEMQVVQGRVPLGVMANSTGGNGGINTRAMLKGLERTSSKET